VKFLIAGLGSIGRRHLKNLVALGEEDIVLYRTGKSTLPDEELKGFLTEYSLDDALGHEPDAVIISNPTALHLDVAIPAAQKGCHLLIEKPISHSMDRINMLVEITENIGIQILVGFQFRFHPTLQMVREYIDDSRLGRVISVRAHWGEYLPDWHPWEDFRDSYAARRELGGGVLLTLCHPLDYLGWIFGEIDTVQGTYESGLDLEVEALVEMNLHFKSGVIASLHLDYLQKPPEHYLAIIGEQGSLYWDGLSGDLIISMTANESSNHEHPPEGFERNDLFLAEMRHFLKVVRGKESPRCTLDEGIRVQQLIENIKHSAQRMDASGKLGKTNE
jgi:predicted dehydrogenase